MRRAYALRRPVENTFLVRQRDSRILRELFHTVLWVVLLGGALLLYTWVHIETLRTGYRNNELERKLHHLESEERRYRLEIALRSHPHQLKSRASKELSMQAPTLEQTLFAQELLP